MKSICFIPVFNQINELPIVLKELKETDLPVDEILLVNNGSSDGSEYLVRNSGYPYIDLPKNRGIGYSFMKATEWALERNFDIFTVIASNGKMLPSEMNIVIKPILEKKADYVTGSRFLKGGDSPNIPKFRKTSIPLVNKFVWFLTSGARLTDATCGYKAYKLSLFRHAEFDWQSQWLETYGFEYYLYSKVILSRKLKWTEVPITMRYPKKGESYSKIKPLIGWWQMLKPWIISRIDGKGFENNIDDEDSKSIHAKIS